MNNIDKFRKYAVLIFIAAGFAAWGMESFKTVPVYEGVGDGYYDDIIVKISAEKNRKGEVRVKSMDIQHKDTPAIADPALENLKQQLMEKQNPEKLDAVAGATYTSEGLIDAVKAAFAKVK